MVAAVYTLPLADAKLLCQLEGRTADQAHYLHQSDVVDGKFRREGGDHSRSGSSEM